HELAGDRQHRAAQRLRRVVGRDEAQVVRGDADRQQGAALDEGGALVVGQPHHLLELGELRDAVPRLPPPVVPLGQAGRWEEAAAEGVRRRVDARQPPREGRQRGGRDGGGELGQACRGGAGGL